MFKPNTYIKSNNGEGEIGGVSIKKLVETYGTPLYVLDEETIRLNCRSYTHTLKKSSFDTRVLYAGKANLNVGLLNIIASEGMGLDVVSGGELYTALRSNINPVHIYFHGNNKSLGELKLAITHGVNIVLDNEQELANIKQVVSELDKVCSIMIRLKPEIEAHTHDYIKTGQLDSKFGLEQNLVKSVISQIVEDPKLEFIGIHSHIGSQIFESKPYYELIDVMIGHLKSIQEDCGVPVRQLNLGGGVGISYTKNDVPIDIPEFLTTLTSLLEKACKKNSLSLPLLLFEPGRSIIGTAGVTLYTVGTIKDIPSVRTYLFVDGGMADNPRPIMYKSEYTFDVLNASDETAVYSIAGKFCESGDILAKDVTLPKASVGDVLVVFGTGAYNYVMSSNYNRSCRPAMVAVNNGTSRLLIKRETYDDIITHDDY